MELVQEGQSENCPSIIFMSLTPHALFVPLGGSLIPFFKTMHLKMCINIFFKTEKAGLEGGHNVPVM